MDDASTPHPDPPPQAGREERQAGGLLDLRARRGPLIVAVVTVAALVLHLPQLLGNNHQDFFIYRAGALLGLRGGSPYDQDALRELVRGQYPGDDRLAENCGFFLAPQAVAVFAPFAALPWPAAKAAWSLASFGLAGLAVWHLTAFCAAPEWSRRFVPLAAVGFLLNPVVLTSMPVGQTSLLFFACVVLGEAAYQTGWRRLAGLLWAVPFCKPHLALPLLPLAWYLGGWRRAVALALWVAGLNVLGGLVSTGSPLLLRDYLAHLAAGHKAVIFNRVDLNFQITSWNRLLFGWTGVAIDLGAVGTLAGYAVWAGLVLGRGALAGERPPPGWAAATAAVGALLCCQVLAYELVLLGLVIPHVLDLAAAGRRRTVLVFLLLLGLASVPFDVIQALGEGGRFGAWEGAVASHRSTAVALLAVTLLVGGWPRLLSHLLLPVRPLFRRRSANLGGLGPGAVLGVHQHHRRLVLLGVLGSQGGERGDDDHVPGLDQVRPGPVHLHHPAAALPGEGVGDQPGAGGHVPDVDLLVRQDVGRVQQVGVDGQAPLVVEFGRGDRGPVDLRLEHFPPHGHLRGAIRPSPVFYGRPAGHPGCSPRVGEQ